MLRSRRQELEATIAKASAELHMMDSPGSGQLGAQQAMQAERAYANECNAAQQTPEEVIDFLFTFYDDPDKTPHYIEIREAAKQFAKVIVRHTPGGVDRLTAINKLRETVMFANACVALSGRGI
jgi:hypothetical protein